MSDPSPIDLLIVDDDTLLLLSGDVPLLSAGTLARLLQRHRDTQASTTVLTMTLDNPHGYGRIVRDEQGWIARIVEERDASFDERRIREVNSGVYAFNLDHLFRAIAGVAAANDLGEYYLPDVVPIHRREGLVVESLKVDDPLEVRGVNSQRDLADLEAIVRARRVDQLMASGVSVVDPATTYVGPDVEIGPDTVAPQRLPRREHAHRLRLRDSCRHAHRRFVGGRLGGRAELLRRAAVSDQIGRRRRTVCPHPPGKRRGARRERGKLRRAEEDRPRSEICILPPD